jgi:hypothetical protein
MGFVQPLRWRTGEAEAEASSMETSLGGYVPTV